MTVSADSGTLELKLANGKSVEGRSGFELECFLASNGSSITPMPSKKTRSKGRGRGRKPK